MKRPIFYFGLLGAIALVAATIALRAGRIAERNAGLSLFGNALLATNSLPHTESPNSSNLWPHSVSAGPTPPSREATTQTSARLPPPSPPAYPYRLPLAASPALHLDRDPKLWTPAFIRSTSRFLTPSHSDVPAEKVVEEFVKANARTLGIQHSDIAPPNAYLSRDVVTKHNGMRSLTYQQRRDGLDIYGATFAINLTKDNEVINISSRALFLESVRFHDERKFFASEAVKIAAEQLGVELSRPVSPIEQATGMDNARLLTGHPELKEPAIVKAVWYPLAEVSAVLAWDIILTMKGNPETHHVIVDAVRGQVLLDQLLTCSLEPLTMFVYTNDSPTPFSPGQSAPTNYQPPEVSRALVTLMALDTNASPSGWITDGINETLGNNIDAYSDWNDDNSPDSTRPQGSPYRVFSNSMNLAGHPTNYLYAAIVQAFYLGNVFHDRLYALGFDEAAGNFQANNFGRGGNGNDAVKIEVQDGWSNGVLNNANFTTMSDGSFGRMQLQIWVRTSPYRDSALDAEVVFHEYAHGVSGRLIGDGYGLSGTQPRGMGEGWSDFMALSLLSEASDDVNGCYAYGAYTGARSDNPNNYYYGSRRFPYTTDTNKAPQTLADTDSAQVGFPGSVPMNPTVSEESADEAHRVGEIWCLALWECRANLIERYGFAGNEKMLQLVVDGMKLTPVSPTFAQARDAILQADVVNNGGTNRLELWKGFARRGLGYSASVPASSTTAGVRESFDLPVRVAAVVTEAAGGDGDGYVEPGEGGRLEIRVTSYEQALHSVTGTLSAVSTNVTVTQGNALLADIGVGGTSTSGVPFEFSVDAGFSGFTDAEFLLTVSFAEGSFRQPVLARIGNPYSYAPEITGIAVTNVGETNATITWITGIPADSQVYYGATTNYGQTTPLDAGLLTNHTVSLVGLTKGTTYHFAVASRGTNGLLGVSQDQTFTTKARIYVHVNSTATQELGTIEAPYKTIQGAADAANPWDELLVAEGTYTGTNVEGVLVLSNATDNLKVYGGYSSDFSVRDTSKYMTSFNGERVRRGGFFLGNGATLEIDGICVANGLSEWGGGGTVRSSTLVANDCIFTDNASTNGINKFGGAIHASLGASVMLRNCVIKGNTVGNGHGGGVFIISSGSALSMERCIISSNTAGAWGGGVYVGATGTLTDCVIHDNVATNSTGGGGGVLVESSATLSRCTITRNSTSKGGGVYPHDVASVSAIINNCIVFSNSAEVLGADIYSGGYIFGILRWTDAVVRCYYSDIGDVSGELDTDVGRINADPLFENAETGDFHLKPNSPCIDAGMALDSVTTDMDGESRPFGPAMDIGADEYTDTDLDAMPDYWESAHGLNPTNAVGNAGRDGDSDNDGLRNWAEFMAGTDPTNMSSVFKLTATDFPATNSIVLKWASVSGRRYNIHRTTNLMNSFSVLASNLPATPAINVYTDTVTGIGPFFYRILVQ